MKILGISAYYHDSAASLLIDGKLVAAAQEERFTRIKHDERFPANAAAYCLQAGGIAAGELDAVAARTIDAGERGYTGPSRLGKGKDRRSSSVWVVAYAPAAGIYSPQKTARPLTFRQWVGPAGRDVASTGEIGYDPNCVSRGLPSLAELDAWCIGAGLRATPPRQ